MKPWCSLISGLFLSSAITVPVQAQISLDGTTNTTLIPTDNGIIIDEGNRAGDNLFHSFEQFSVPNGSEAFFNNPNDIVNIFSRVTGGNISNIDGLIRANGDANLFLINPAGIVFGENASLNLGGSFFGSTAESIVFDNNTEFSVTDADNSPLLKINMPIGLNFGNNSGDIAVNDSNLQVNNGETLALLGGDVTITGGQIIAPGANIELGGLTEAEQVSFEGLGDEISFSSISFPEGIPRGDITLTNGAEVNVQAAGGGNISINARNLELSGGEFGASNLSAGITSESNSLEAQAGNITINATNNITVSQGSFIANNLEESGVGNAGGIDITTANLSLTQGSLVIASTRGKGDAGTIIIKASETILADGEDQDGNPSGIFQAINPSGIRSMVLPTGEGNSGGINITTANLSLTQGSLVIASTRGKGDAGAITINASATISADGETEDGFSSSIRSIVLPTGEGNSGGINITTANLSLTQGGIVSTTTFGQGNAGAITINASGTISADGGDQAGISGGIFSRVSLAAIGNSGGINITTANLSLTQGSTVNVSTFGQGDAGAININALGTISADGETQTGLVSGIFSEVEKSAIGDSDGINITTANLSLTQGGRVDASTRGQGNAGTITIKASETISADGSGTILADREGRAGSGIFSTAGEFGEGNAADININTNRLSLTKGAEISVESLGQGNAGNLDIQANSLALSNRASLFASTPVGNGGNITLQIADNLTLRDNSTISAQALEEANGGNIDIDAGFVIAFANQNNDIVASAAQGTGGNIDISTNGIFAIEERSSTPPNITNDIDASSEFGLDGTVEINELDVNPAEGLEELPAEVIDVAGLVEKNLCQQGEGSEFIVTGKGGIAPSPTQVRDRALSEVDLVEPALLEEDEGDGEGREEMEDGEVGEVKEEIVEARGWMINDRGILELVAYSTDPNGSPAQPQDDQICHK